MCVRCIRRRNGEVGLKTSFSAKMSVSWPFLFLSNETTATLDTCGLCRLADERHKFSEYVLQ